MKQKLFFIIIILVSLTNPAEAKEDFFPHREGLSWTYSNGETQSLSGPYDVEGVEVMILTHTVEDQLISEDYLVYNEAGVYSMGTSTMGGDLLRYEPPLVIYEGNQLRVGQVWQSTTVLRGLEISLLSEITGVQGIETPLGRFNALIIRQSTITNTGGRTTLHIYFVPAVGVVRFVQGDGTIVDLVDKNF